MRMRKQVSGLLSSAGDDLLTGVEVNDLLVKKNIDTVIHIDAASGGFVAPFVVPELEWDFRLEKVVSINVSGHKYILSTPAWKIPH